MRSFNKGHLGSSPAEQSKSKLADGRDHQVQSHGSPRFVSGRFCLLHLPSFVFSGHKTRSVWTWPCLHVSSNTARVLGCTESLHAIFFLWLFCSWFLLLGEFKDGETPLKAVHVGGGSSRTLFRLQVRVSCSFLVQQETLKRQKTIIITFAQWQCGKYESSLLKTAIFHLKPLTVTP